MVLVHTLVPLFFYAVTLWNEEQPKVENEIIAQLSDYFVYITSN